MLNIYPTQRSVKGELWNLLFYSMTYSVKKLHLKEGQTGFVNIYGEISLVQHKIFVIRSYLISVYIISDLLFYLVCSYSRNGLSTIAF